MDISKILVAVDSSEFALKAAKKAVSLAKNFKAEVGIVFVIEPIKPIAAAELGYMAVDVIEKSKQEADALLAKICDECNVKAKCFTPEGPIAEMIIKTAEDFGANVLSLSTHGRTGLLHLLLGSVAQSVVQNSPIPVLVFPSKCL